jgi:hypothetical protein
VQVTGEAERTGGGEVTAGASPGRSAGALVGQLVDAYVDAHHTFHPHLATLNGDHRFDRDLGDPTADATVDLLALVRTLLAATDATDIGLLDHEERIEFLLLVSELETAELDLEHVRLWARDPSRLLHIPVAACFGLLISEHLPARERADAMLSRLEQVPGWLAAGRATISDAPAPLIETAELTAPAALDFLTGTVPGWMEAHVPEQAETTGDLVQRAVAAVERFAGWVRELSPSPGAGIGETAFAERLRVAHLLVETPSELAERGERIIAETLDLLDELAAARDAPGGWREQVEELKSDHPDRTSLVAEYEQAMRWSRRLVQERDLVPPPPGDPELVVEPTPGPWRNTIPYAAYLRPPPFQPPSVGRFWVTPPGERMPADAARRQLADHARASLPVVAVHEGYPGHHLQLAWANAHPSPLRRITDAPMFVEGWGLYCEELFHRYGLYDDAARMWQLKDRLWRGVRVVVDVGLHTGELEVDECVRHLVETAGLDPSNAGAEVRRYAASPTQPMSYAIGMDALVALRERSRAEEGSSFDERDFHTRLLRNGTLPPTLASEALTG